MPIPDSERHGHIVPRADGNLCRCGGPAWCPVCVAEVAALGLTLDEYIASIRIGNARLMAALLGIIRSEFSSDDPLAFVESLIQELPRA